MPDKLVTIHEYLWDLAVHADKGLPVAVDTVEKRAAKKGRVIPPAVSTGALTAIAQEMHLGTVWYEVDWSKNLNWKRLEEAVNTLAQQPCCASCGFPDTPYVTVAKCNGHSGMGCGEYFCDECMEAHMSSDCFAEDTPEHEEPKRAEGPY